VQELFQDPPQVTIVIADQGSREFWQDFKKQMKQQNMQFDIILDDGELRAASHGPRTGTAVSCFMFLEAGRKSVFVLHRRWSCHASAGKHRVSANHVTDLQEFSVCKPIFWHPV
jgi:hypothetical protein